MTQQSQPLSDKFESTSVKPGLRKHRAQLKSFMDTLIPINPGDTEAEPLPIINLSKWRGNFRHGFHVHGEIF